MPLNKETEETKPKEFQVLLFNTNKSIQKGSLVWTQLNGSKYCYVSLVQLK